MGSDLGDIELEEEGSEVNIVNVTGTSYNDSVKKTKKKHSFRLSLRDTTFLIFSGLLILYVLAIFIMIMSMNESFEVLDKSECNRSVNRVSVAISSDLTSLRELAQQFAFWDAAVNVTKNHDLVDDFITDNFMLMEGCEEDDEDCAVFNTDLAINYIGFIDVETFDTWWSVYYPPPADNSDQVAEGKPQLPPRIKPEILREIAQGLEDPNSGWNLVIFPEGATDLFFIAVEPICNSTYEDDTNVYGYFMAGRNVAPRIQSFSNDVPTCISIECKDSDGQYWDKTDRKSFEASSPGTFADDNTFGGVPEIVFREGEYLDGTKNRFCPEEGINKTSDMAVGYFILCDFEPEDGHYSTCVRIRVDNPMTLTDQGTAPMVILSVAVIILMIVLCIIFLVFLDCVVLRPILNLSNVLEKQAEWQIDDDLEEIHSDRVNRHRRGKSAFGSDGHSQRTTTTVTDDSYANSSKDEIGKLRTAMERNAKGIRRRLKTIDQELRNEQQKTARHRQAMQLLNLWRGHKTFFPGLRPNAMEMRYEPPRNLDDLLNSPLAIEFLKSHCETDRSLENLWFLLDVSWLEELEKAREREDNPERRSQLRDIIISAAKAIMSRYIAADSAQQINISSITREKLREMEDRYERGMFNTAVSEVKMLLNLDVLPRFQQSPAYAAMSEALYSVAPTTTETDRSDFSEDSGSTAGSILTDDTDDDAGVARVYAHTFKSLHSNFALSSGTSMISLPPGEDNRVINGVLHLGPARAKDRSSGVFSKDSFSAMSSDLSQPEDEKPKDEDVKEEQSTHTEESTSQPSKEDSASEEHSEDKSEPSKEDSANKEHSEDKSEPSKDVNESEEHSVKEEEKNNEEPGKDNNVEESGEGSETSSSSSLSGKASNVD